MGSRSSLVEFFPLDRTNDYQAILSAALASCGVDVVAPTFGWGGEVKHIHWFESLFDGRLARLHPVMPSLIAQAHSLAIRKMRKNGGRLIWTAHNVVPHETPSGGSGRAWDIWKHEIVPQLDGVILLNCAHEPLIKAAWPALSEARFTTIPHPHFRSVYPVAEEADRLATRLDFGCGARDFVLGAFGLMRPYKGLVELLQAFREVAHRDERLVLAGPCSDFSLIAKLEGARGQDTRIVILPERADAATFARWHSGVDACVFNFDKILNSGSILAALSLDKPIIAPAFPAIDDISGAVGSGWAQTFRAGELPQALRRLMDGLRGQRLPGRPDLSSFEPDFVARKHLSAYGLR